jgi:anti-sigma B factor antagonist
MSLEATHPAHDTTELTIEARRTTGPAGPVRVLHCGGEIDMATAPLLRDALAAVHDADVLVDLRDTTFVDSTGLSALLNALRRLTRAGRRLAIACPPGAVRETIRLTDLVETLRVADDERAALALLAR